MSTSHKAWNSCAYLPGSKAKKDHWANLVVLIIAPYSFLLQVPSREIDKAEGKFWTHWNRETKQVAGTLQHLSWGLKRERRAEQPVGTGSAGRAHISYVHFGFDAKVFTRSVQLCSDSSWQKDLPVFFVKIWSERQNLWSETCCQQQQNSA